MKKNLSPSALAESGGSATGSQMLELTRAMALLAFGPETTCTIYQVNLLRSISTRPTY